MIITSMNLSYLFIFSNSWCSSKSSTKVIIHFKIINLVYGDINLLKYFYILATSPKTHYRIISLKKLKLEFLDFKKSFVDVDGFFLCLEHGGNSPQKTFSYIINI
jgi:hypothetical protein